MTRLASRARLRSVVLAAASGVAVAVAAPARADEPRQHVVRRSETCAAIATLYYGDARLVDVIHRANPVLAATPPPHVLREGMVLVIPPTPDRAKGPDAQLTTVRNDVQVLAPETKPGKPNDPLFRGNRVSTQAESAADVTFRDETQVKLGERTLVIILGDARSAAARVTENETALVTGNLRAFMAGPRRDSAASVATDAARVKVYSGEAQVSADAKKTTRLAVYGGSSTIAAAGRTREVTPGFGAKAELGKEPTPPRPLPPMPAWTTPPPLVLLDNGDARIVAEYDAAGAKAAIAEWHVQVARDGIFRDVAVDTKAVASVRRLEVRPPGPGRYYVRVSAIDDDRFEGPFSRTARVLVVGVRSTPLPAGRQRLVIEPPDAWCVRVGNVALTHVDKPIDAAAREPVRVRCAPSPSDPTTLLRLDADGSALSVTRGNVP